MKRNSLCFPIVCLFVALLPTLSSAQATGGDPANLMRAAAIADAQRKIAEQEAQLKELQADEQQLREREQVLRDQWWAAIESQAESGVSNESFAEIIKMLHTQRVELMIDLAGLEARRDMLREVRSSRQQNMPENALQLIRLLEDALALEQKNLARTQSLYDNAMKPEIEVEAAQKRVLEAEAKLLEARGKLELAAEESLPEELLALSLERSEKRARLDKIKELLVEVAGQRNNLETTQSLSIQRDSLANQLSAVQAKFRRQQELINSLKAQLARLRAADQDR